MVRHTTEQRGVGSDTSAGEHAYSSWAAKEYFWSTADYETDGFQDKYIDEKLRDRRGTRLPESGKADSGPLSCSCASTP